MGSIPTFGTLIIAYAFLKQARKAFLLTSAGKDNCRRVHGDNCHLLAIEQGAIMVKTLSGYISAVQPGPDGWFR